MNNRPFALLRGSFSPCYWMQAMSISVTGPSFHYWQDGDKRASDFSICRMECKETRISSPRPIVILSPLITPICVLDWEETVSRHKADCIDSKLVFHGILKAINTTAAMCLNLQDCIHLNMEEYAADVIMSILRHQSCKKLFSALPCWSPPIYSKNDSRSFLTEIY